MKYSYRELQYLIVIKKLNDGNKPAKLTEVARDVSVTASSAFEEIKHLSDKGLIKKEGQKIWITDEGKDYINKAIRAHRVVESFLVKLGMDKDEACNYSRQFDLLVPEEIVEKLYSFLGKPNNCPHGEGIP
ncbi:MULTISPECIES: metal-dependent transcriptional regulator [Acidianus]|uniref:DtxR family iron (Metal) dependent repressor n=1 Tax=Candidatus Acidianus copahuensis TaxID=1160895 RepID=A0A031LLH0_9CREN|nr:MULTISPECIES: metal-dependent transcriptional regulator [Acidianus]EZQ02084.1 DtxR family iron (metal) dependent repressor [Candidatus Acidianus copahuensis]NON63285.1 metal-dependent transcriptional regulator [Acidianus sp. RZ1]